MLHTSNLGLIYYEKNTLSNCSLYHLKCKLCTDRVTSRPELQDMFTWHMIYDYINCALAWWLTPVGLCNVVLLKDVGLYICGCGSQLRCSWSWKHSCISQVPLCPECPDPAELRAAGHANADWVPGARGAGGEPGWSPVQPGTGETHLTRG